MQQLFAHSGVVDTRRETHAVQLRQAVRRIHHEVDVQGFEPGGQRFVIAPVARPRILQTFFLQDHQGFVQPIECVDRAGVVVGALRAFAPVGHYQLQVQEPALRAVLAGLDGSRRALAEGDGGQARHAGQALLRTRINRVGAPAIHVYFDTGEARHGVDDTQAVVLTSEPAKFRRVRTRTG